MFFFTYWTTFGVTAFVTVHQGGSTFVAMDTVGKISVVVFQIIYIASILISGINNLPVFIRPQLPKRIYHDNGIFYFFKNRDTIKIYEDRLLYLKRLVKIKYNSKNTKDEIESSIRNFLDKHSKEKTRTKSIDEEFQKDIFLSKSIKREEKLKKII